MNILQKTKQYLIDFKNEASFFFWLYLLFPLLGSVIFKSNEVKILSIISLLIYPFLLKKSGLLGNNFIYIFLAVSFLFILSVDRFFFSSFTNTYLKRSSVYYCHYTEFLIYFLFVIISSSIVFMYICFREHEINIINFFALFFMLLSSWHGILFAKYLFLMLIMPT